jgi:hypothetical protein
VNYTKSATAMLNCDAEDAALVNASLGCPTVELLLPMTYLGIPLTIRCPTWTHLQPLIERVAHQLPTWKEANEQGG